MSEDSKKQDAEFLVEGFGITPQAAADLVLDDTDQADELAREIMSEEREPDPLAGVPVPGSGQDPEHEEKGIEDLEKPIDNTASAPT